MTCTRAPVYVQYINRQNVYVNSSNGRYVSKYKFSFCNVSAPKKLYGVLTTYKTKTTEDM